jgi:hypothetical protein
MQKKIAGRERRQKVQRAGPALTRPFCLHHNVACCCEVASFPKTI